MRQSAQIRGQCDQLAEVVYQHCNSSRSSSSTIRSSGSTVLGIYSAKMKKNLLILKLCEEKIPKAFDHRSY